MKIELSWPQKIMNCPVRETYFTFVRETPKKTNFPVSSAFGEIVQLDRSLTRQTLVYSNKGIKPIPEQI